MRAISLFLGLILALPLAAQVDGDPSPYSEASLVADADAVRPGESIDVAVRLDLDEGWHSYWINPGDSGLPVVVEWTALEGATAGPLQFPYPERYDIEGLTSYAFEGSPHFLTRVAVPDDASGTLDLEADVTWLVCEEICLPAEQTVSLSIPVGEPTTTGALEDARGYLPVKAEGWTASAAATPDGYVLSLDPPDGWTGDLEGAQFYVDETGVIDHPAGQAWQQEGGAWAVA
ncbi:protein-disulfide reductase DsbD domain-containing protein, partial [Rubrivirga sp.]|uniref:protein-disulfide reductase DsbD domain-containing protein n=1 Tax=Rubrivirga sp. TaxID=1885344 RepID=UPI003C70A715